jgi:threonine dehydratase
VDSLVQLQDVIAAQARIQGKIRRTPLMLARPMRYLGIPHLFLKLENLQVTGSFKARGAVSKLTSLPPEAVANGIITASGGNHGLGVAYAGWMAGSPATIYLANNTPPAKIQKFQQWGAQVVVEGQVWDDANNAALRVAKQQNLTYFHPFADPVVIAGQGTIALELLDEQPDLDVIVVAIGGGGLASGVALTAKSLKPSIKVIGVEPTGAPTLLESLRAGHLVELPAITTAANTLAPRRSEAINLELIHKYIDSIVLVSDDEMRAAARWLWSEMGIAAELSGSAALAALLAGRASVDTRHRVCVLVCGAGTDGI